MNQSTQYKQLLNKSKLKATNPRLSVLKLLDKSSAPLSINDIQTALKNSSPDLATLYRIVQQLKDKGLLVAINMQHNHAHYELATKKHHHHIICTSCNKVVDLESCLLNDVEKVAKKNNGFSSITEHSLEFFGVCNNCSKLKS